MGTFAEQITTKSLNLHINSLNLLKVRKKNINKLMNGNINI